MSHEQPITEQDLLMREAILKEACKRESGFCPACNAVLVPEQAVSVDLIVAVSGHTLYRNVLCAACYDDCARDLITDVYTPAGAVWRIIDGRQLYRPSPAPQRPPSG